MRHPDGFQPLIPIIAAVALMAGAMPCRAGAAEEADEPVQWLLAPGRYQFIGRQPDLGATYAGTARIDRVGDKLRLRRTVGGRTTTAFGVVRRADPGEAYVLDFKWNQRHAMEMVCLVGTDLDNYGRLTCHWGRVGTPHRQPGMEAYFAREPWDPVTP